MLTNNTVSLPRNLERSGIGGTFPVTTCFLNIPECCAGTTNHYCLKEDGAHGLLLIDGKRVCGKPFCNLCAFHAGYEGNIHCPLCHECSNMKMQPLLVTTGSSTDRNNERALENISPITVRFGAPTAQTQQSNTPPTTVHQMGESSSAVKALPRTQKELIDTVLTCDDLYIPHDQFFYMMQDPGEELRQGARCKNGYWKSKKEPNVQFKILKTAGEMFLDLT